MAQLYLWHIENISFPIPVYTSNLVTFPIYTNKLCHFKLNSFQNPDKNKEIWIQKS